MGEMKKLCLIGLLICFSFSPVAQAQPTQAAQPSPSAVEMSAAMKLAAIEQSEKEASITRERHDLAAQESMARSANSLLEPSWWQVWIGAFGLAGLLISLSFNAWSLRQTRTALRSQRDTSKAQMRAYVGLDGLAIQSFQPGHKIRLGAILKNYGQTPAYDVVISCAVKFLPKGAEPNYAITGADPGPTINPGGISTSYENGPILTDEMFGQFKSGELADGAAVTFVVEVSYTTLGEAKVLQIASIHWGAGLEQHKILPDHNRCD